MSIALAMAVRARLEVVAADASSDLAVWVAAHEVAPTVVLGYRRPTGADGWPFVAVEPLVDTRDLVTQRASAGGVAIACGYRLAQVGRGDADGILAVEGLVDAVLAAVVRPWRVEWARELWYAASAERVAAAYAHPGYEVELRLDFGRVGQGAVAR